MRRNPHVRFCRRANAGNRARLASDDGTLRCVAANPATVAGMVGLHVNAVAPVSRRRSPDPGPGPGAPR